MNQGLRQFNSLLGKPSGKIPLKTMAAIINCSQRALSPYINGIAHYPRIESKLARTLGLTIFELRYLLNLKISRSIRNLIKRKERREPGYIQKQVVSAVSAIMQTTIIYRWDAQTASGGVGKFVNRGERYIKHPYWAACLHQARSLPRSQIVRNNIGQLCVERLETRRKIE